MSAGTRRAHEDPDVSPRPIVAATLGLVLMIVLSVLFALWLFRIFTGPPVAGGIPPAAPGTARPRPPEPRLQIDPARELRALRAAEDQVLGSYGWVDRDAGVVRVPIDRAIDAVVAEAAGAPADESPPASPKAAPPDAAPRVETPPDVAPPDDAPVDAGSPYSGVLPEAARKAGMQERLGAALPLDVVLRDEEGRSVRLGDYLGRRPAILAFVYYRCPMLCPLVLDGVVRGLRAVALRPGGDFDVIVVSFDPREGPDLARARRETTEKAYGRPGTEAGWHFLTGDEPSIAALTSAAGFRYAWDEGAAQYAHAAGVLVLTPTGRIHRWLGGVEYAPRDLRLGLVEAAAGRIGTAVDQLLLLCYHYDPANGRYGVAILGALRALATGTLVGLGAFVVAMLRRERARARSAG